MTSRQALLPLLRFEVDEKRQKITDIEMMILDFRRVADDLDQQIEIEERRVGVADVGHVLYSTFAKAARQRRDNLLQSIAELERQLEKARIELDEAQATLLNAERAQERETGRARASMSPALAGDLDPLRFARR